MDRNFVIKENVLKLVLDTLMKLPYKDVAPLIEELSTKCMVVNITSTEKAPENEAVDGQQAQGN